MSCETTKSIIKVFGTGSSGNCLAIYDKRGKYILIDVGVKYSEVLKGVNYDLSNCVAVLCDHRHADHAKNLDHFIHNGIPCYSNKDVCDLYVGCQQIGKCLKIDGFKIQTFDLVHNVPNLAFVVDTIDGIRILYCTDTKYVPKVVKGVHYAIIECNHDIDEMIDHQVDENFVSQSQHDNHQDIDTCIEYLKRIYNGNMQKVVLWHMSSTNIDPIKAQKKVKEEMSFPNVEIGCKGLEIALNKEEF